MFSDVYQPASFGPAVTCAFHALPCIHPAADERSAFQVVPINLSPEEIRAMVRDILG